MKNMIIYLLYLIFFIPTLNAQTTAIPDTDFEQKLIDLNIDSDGLVNGQILNSDAIGVTSLTLISGDISDLTGIGAFVNLDSLYLDINSLTSLDLTNNTALTSIEFVANYSLTSLDLTHNTALTSLFCKNNAFTSLDLSSNTALLYLNCHNNPFTSLDLTNNTALTSLTCTDNPLTSLDLTNNTALTSLTCRATTLTSLNLTNNTALTSLSCRVTPLTNLDLTNNTALTSLTCDYNSNLTSLDLSHNTALTSLFCRNNTLTNLDLSHNTALTSLGFRGNTFTSLDLTNNTALTLLDFESNPTLTSLNITHNTALTYLSCKGTALTSLDLTNNTALTSLNCDYNSTLTSLNLTNNAALLYLNCRATALTSLDLTNNTALTFLDCGNNTLASLDLTNNTALTYLGCINNALTSLDLTNNIALASLYAMGNSPQLQICVPNIQVVTNNNNWSKDATATYSENCSPLAIEGKVVMDDNLNCVADSLELGLIGQFIKFERVSDSIVFHTITYDSLGNYKAYLDTGTYIASVVPSYPYWQGCPSNQIVVVDTFYNLQTINWTLQPQILCPMLNVDISAPFLRMTGQGSFYTVSYCNNGTIAAQNAYVEVDIDADLNVLSSSIPPVSQNGTIYTYNIGNVGVGACGSFNIQVLVDTSALFEQTHCTEAHIYPDSSCLTPWVDARVDGQVTCLNDSVFFHLDNVGAAMLQPLGYSVIQDDIAMRTGTIQLTAGQSIIIAEAAVEGSTYRILVDQLPGYPSILGDSIFTLAIEGCNPFPNDSFNTGFITQFSNGNRSPFIAVDCQQNIASYDPNDKAAQPEGYGPSHYIYQETALEYKIRFQNTGTDTAFNILITDVISPYFDITTLEMGASSHTYTWSIDNNNLLKVSFDDILLVDSNANEPLSHGFFRYRIEQKANNPLEAVIENTAAIYFDYNPSIVTNTTFHTVGENFVPMTVSIDKIYEEALQITAFPNPFTHSTTIKVAGKEYETLHLSVFDLSGRAVAEKEVGFNNQIELSRGNLQAGIYFYRLLGDGQLINTGKLIVQ